MPLTIFTQDHHAAGNCPDTNPLQIDLSPVCMVLDLAIFDNIAMVQFSADGIHFSTPREFPAGVLSSLNMLVSSIRLVNKTPGSVARYDLTGYYGPIEVTGVPFSLPVKPQ